VARELSDKQSKHVKRLNEAGKATQWKPGQSGNPSGKGKLAFDVAKQSRKSGPEVVRFWKEIMQNPKMPIGQRMRASENLMNRGFGKSVEALHLRADLQIDHRSAHLAALKLVNEEAAADTLRLTKRNDTTIEDKSYRDVTAGDKSEDITPD
jgi:hypothetical protein